MDKKTQSPNTLLGYLTQAVQIIVIIYLFTSAIIFITYGILSISFEYSLDYGEAPLIDQALRIRDGSNIYSPDISIPPYTITNYPPIYILSISPFVGLQPHPFFAGRLISFSASILSAILLGLTIFTSTRSKFAALITSGFFLSVPYIVQWAGLARIDNLALLFSSGAIYYSVKNSNSKWYPIINAVMLTAAIYTRQSYALAAPLAVFAYTWTKNKRSALLLAGATATFVLLSFLMLNTITKGGFYIHTITANVNKFGWDRVSDQLKDLWGLFYISLLLGAFSIVYTFKKQSNWPLIAFFFFGAALSALTIGKIGSNVNYFLELSAALSLAVGNLIGYAKKKTPWIYFCASCILVFQLGILVKETMDHQVDSLLTPRISDSESLQELEVYIKNKDGVILADEDMGLLTGLSQPIYLQPFEISQLVDAGKIDQQRLLSEFQDQKFSAILIHHFGAFPVYKERWTPEMLAHISKYYTPKKTLAGTVIYEPVRSQVITSIPDPLSNHTPSNAELEDVIRLGIAGTTAQPDIAISPINPDHLAVIVNTTSKKDCTLPNCKIILDLFTSVDGGKSWTSQNPFSLIQPVAYNGIVEFNQSGELFALGILGDTIAINSSSAAEDYRMGLDKQEEITRAQFNAKPWLQPDFKTNDLYLTMDAQEANKFVTPSLITSINNGVSWSTTSRVDQRVSITDIYSGKANNPDDIQVLLTSEDTFSLIWTWEPAPWSWPKTVWMANAEKSNKFFTEPVPVTTSFGPVNSASNGQVFAVIFKTGTESMPTIAVAVTLDQGMTWQSALVSGSIPLLIDVEKASGIDIAPNGIIDVLYYAPIENISPCRSNFEDWPDSFWTGSIDQCVYNIYYTYSSDFGKTYSDPIPINSEPIRGEDFLQFNGRSIAATHLSIQSTNTSAFSIWIGTPDPDKTQPYLRKINR